MKCRLQLKKSWINSIGRKYAVGTVLQVTTELFKKLIDENIAEDYDGVYPPKKKKIKLSDLNK